MKGISHVTFMVRDLERMAMLLCEGLGAREVYDSAGHEFSLSREKFLSSEMRGWLQWKASHLQSGRASTLPLR